VVGIDELMLFWQPAFEFFFVFAILYLISQNNSVVVVIVVVGNEVTNVYAKFRYSPLCVKKGIFRKR